MKKSTEVRSDHLMAVIIYALEQAQSSGIEVLNFGDNEQALNLDEQIEYLQQLEEAVDRLTNDGHCELTISKE